MVKLAGRPPPGQSVQFCTVYIYRTKTNFRFIRSDEMQSYLSQGVSQIFLLVLTCPWTGPLLETNKEKARTDFHINDNFCVFISHRRKTGKNKILPSTRIGECALLACVGNPCCALPCLRARYVSLIWARRFPKKQTLGLIPLVLFLLYSTLLYSTLLYY